MAVIFFEWLIFIVVYNSQSEMDYRGEMRDRLSSAGVDSPSGLGSSGQQVGEPSSPRDHSHSISGLWGTLILPYAFIFLASKLKVLLHRNGQTSKRKEVWYSETLPS